MICLKKRKYIIIVMNKDMRIFDEVIEDDFVYILKKASDLYSSLVKKGNADYNVCIDSFVNPCDEYPIAVINSNGLVIGESEIKTLIEEV
jgi:hypothetical protein